MWHDLSPLNVTFSKFQVQENDFVHLFRYKLIIIPSKKMLDTFRVNVTQGAEVQFVKIDVVLEKFHQRRSIKLP